MWLLRLWGHICSHPEGRGHLGPAVRYRLKSLETNLVSQAAAGRGGASKMGAARLLPLAVAFQPGGRLPCREVGEQQRRQLQLLPL